MFRLAVLFCVAPFLMTSGLIRTLDNVLTGFDDNGLNLEGDNVRKVVADRNVWVLRLGGGGLEDLKLRRSSEEEGKLFQDAVGPVIRSVPLPLRRRKASNLKNQQKIDAEQDDPKMDKQLLNDVMRIVNKFVLSTNKEPDAYLSESEDEPTLALMFKGPYTLLLVQYGRKQWNYVIPPTSPLPAWFNRQPDGADDRSVPDGVRTRFYQALARMLHMFLSYPA